MEAKVVLFGKQDMRCHFLVTTVNFYSVHAGLISYNEAIRLAAEKELESFGCGPSLMKAPNFPITVEVIDEA
jgi:hypothetical protein